MMNKFSSIDNVCHMQEKLVDLTGKFYFITSSNTVSDQWKDVFKKHEANRLIDPDNGLACNITFTFNQMKPFFKGILPKFCRVSTRLRWRELQNISSMSVHRTRSIGFTQQSSSINQKIPHFFVTNASLITLT